MAAALAVFVPALVAITNPPADAWNRLYCRGVSNKIQVWVTSNQAPTTALMKAANRWESGTSGFNFVKSDTERNRDM